MKEISPKTKVFAVIGDPIGHSMSPLIQNYIAKLRNCDMAYHAMHVRPENLEAAVKGGEALGISGFNVTVPHKKAVMQYLCAVDTRAEAIGAVNTLKLTENGYVGYNTDITGAYYALKENGADVKDKIVVVLGAGGAGNACAAMAMSRGAEKVYIANRTKETAEKLAKHLSKYFPAPAEAIDIRDIYGIEKADVIINTTTLGFGDKAGLTPVEDIGWYEKTGASVAFDAVYSPWETVFVQGARQKGLKAINGFSMLVYQAAAAQEIWFDTEFAPEFRSGVCADLTKYYLENIQNK